LRFRHCCQAFATLRCLALRRCGSRRVDRAIPPRRRAGRRVPCYVLPAALDATRLHFTTVAGLTANRRWATKAGDLHRVYHSRTFPARTHCLPLPLPCARSCLHAARCVGLRGGGMDGRRYLFLARRIHRLYFPPDGSCLSDILPLALRAARCRMRRAPRRAPRYAPAAANNSSLCLFCSTIIFRVAAGDDVPRLPEDCAAIPYRYIRRRIPAATARAGRLRCCCLVATCCRTFDDSRRYLLQPAPLSYARTFARRFVAAHDGTIIVVAGSQIAFTHRYRAATCVFGWFVAAFPDAAAMRELRVRRLDAGERSTNSVRRSSLYSVAAHRFVRWRSMFVNLVGSAAFAAAGRCARVRGSRTPLNFTIKPVPPSWSWYGRGVSVPRCVLTLPEPF